MVGWMDGQTDGWMDWQMDGRMSGWMDAWIDGWMDGWMDAYCRSTNQWMDGRICKMFISTLLNYFTVFLSFRPRQRTSSESLMMPERPGRKFYLVPKRTRGKPRLWRLNFYNCKRWSFLENNRPGLFIFALANLIEHWTCQTHINSKWNCMVFDIKCQC